MQISSEWAISVFRPDKATVHNGSIRKAVNFLMAKLVLQIWSNQFPKAAISALWPDRAKVLVAN